MGAEVAYGHSKSVGNFAGRYSSVSGGFTASRQLVRFVHLVLGYNARSYDSPNFANYNRVIQQARIGVGFTPGDVPLRIW
jgi:hypothetical protein